MQQQTNFHGTVHIISLPNDFKKVVVQGKGILLELSSDGKITTHEQAEVQQKETSFANTKVGDLVDNDTIYAGISPDNGKLMFAAQLGAEQAVSHNDAVKFADSLDVSGHNDWRLPSINELDVMFEHGLLSQTFNKGSSVAKPAYIWSSEASSEQGNWRMYRPDNGDVVDHSKSEKAVTFCIRTGPESLFE